MNRKQKAQQEQDEAANRATVGHIMRRLNPQARQAVLAELSSEDRRTVLEAELDSRKACWNRQQGPEGGGRS
jgi:hypothetical protein